MIEEEKSYSYDELKNIFKNAEIIATTNFDKIAKDATKGESKNKNELDTFLLMHTLQNMMAFAELRKVLFKKDEE